MNLIKYVIPTARVLGNGYTRLTNKHIFLTPTPTSAWSGNILCQEFSDSHRHNNKPQNYKQSASVTDEKLFIVQHTDPDVFGNQAGIGKYETDDQPLEADLGDIAEEEYLSSPPNRSNRLSTKQYADQIKEHLRNKRIKEAIDVLEVRMIREDRVKPENYIYNLLIGGCARTGYTSKAFSLFNRMKQRDLKVTGGTYTSLFNACSTSPWVSDGLKKANRLREIMLEKGYEPNASNYNAMIKAYGRCADLKTAFQLVDEMHAKEIPINVDTFNFLLQACASDREFGCLHAIQVWHKMFQKRLIPDIYSFNLMLRCVRDCNLGDLQTMEEVIQTILSNSRPEAKRINTENKKLLKNTEENLTNYEIEQNGALSNFVVNSQTVIKDDAPNLLAKRPHLGKMIGISEIRKPEDRLLLLGGMSGFLHEMQMYKAEPTIKTFTQLLEVIPPTLAAEKKIIATIQRLGIKCDIDFFNVLIKKRSMRFDYVSAKVNSLTQFCLFKLFISIFFL